MVSTLVNLVVPCTKFLHMLLSKPWAQKPLLRLVCPYDPIQIHVRITFYTVFLVGPSCDNNSSCDFPVILIIPSLQKDVPDKFAIMESDAEPTVPLLPHAVHHVQEDGLERPGGIVHRPKPNRKPEILATLVACLAPLSMGIVLGFSSPTLPELKNTLTETQQSWYGSLINIGAIAGGPVAGIATEVIGRKATVMICNLPFSIGWFLLAYANEYVMLYCGRLLTGLGMGMCSLATPIYIAEISSKDMRGTLGSLFQLFVTFGILAVYALGILLDRRWLSAACGFVPAAMVFAMLPCPESPRYLLSKGARQDAVEALRWLRGTMSDASVENECSEMEAMIRKQANQRLSPVELCSNPTIRKPLMISLCLMVFQQASGINNVIFYSTKIFSQFKNAEIPELLVATVQVAFTAVAVVFMDRAGRRLLLIIAGIMTCLSSVGLGVAYYLDEEHHVKLTWLSLASVLIFIAFFSVGWAPIPWLVMAEIFPERARGMASSIATAVNWSCSFLITKEFADLESAVHSYGAFWIYGGMIFLGILFVMFFLPETKGKSLEDIEKHFMPPDPEA